MFGFDKLKGKLKDQIPLDKEKDKDKDKERDENGQEGSGSGERKKKKSLPWFPPWKLLEVKESDETIRYVQITNKSLASTLYSITGDNTFINSPVSFFLLLSHLEKLRNAVINYKNIQPLLDLIENEEDEENAKLNSYLDEGLIHFDGLWKLFPIGGKFVSTKFDEEIGSTITNCMYQRNIFGGMYIVYGSNIISNGRRLVTIDSNYQVGQFRGVKKISKLAIRPMTDEIYERLHRRGLIFKEIALGPHYKHYTGNMFYNNGWSIEKFKATGRVVTDCANFSRFNPNYSSEFFQHVSATPQTLDQSEIPDELVFTCSPVIAGFSLANKRWGQINITNLTDIQFDDKAFDQLVMESSRKHLVKCLVENSNRGFTDIISGKGGGCVFLLHGPPGTGKTLTSEAIADLLKKPLYSVTVGELGVTPKDLEMKLKEILDLAWEWDAVLLIDEADIFLEKRSLNDITRNAMVGIFLRLLEYHQGVLFLTTNRVESFDEAFHSRISIALRYEALDQEKRKQVFENLLTAAGIEGVDVNELSRYDLNGRQIKSAIRLAQALALAEKTKVCFDHFAKTLETSIQFQNFLSGIEQ